MAYAALESTDWHPSLARDEGPIQTQILTLQHLLECSNDNGYIMLPVDWLTECVVPRASCDLSEAARQALIVELGSGFFNLGTEWSLFNDQITSLDEIWEFDSPGEYWESFCGSSGIALVRGPKVIAAITCEMN